MAVTDQQKLDFLLKKIGYTKTKTGNVDGTGNPGEGSVKQPFAEAIPSPLVVPNSSLWNEADSIPATPPGSDTTQVKVYSASSAVRLTEDITVSTASQARSWIAYSTYNNTSSARLTNWIDTQFGAGYLIKVYNGDPNSGGTPLSAGATNQNWFFDYSAGVLNFNDDTCPVSPSDSIYIVGYRYIGQTGAPTSGISTFSYFDLTVERNLDVGVQGGISTFRNNIDANGIIEGIAGENKIPFLYSNLAALPNAGTYHGMFAHVHSEGRGYFAHAGNWLELVNKDTNGNVGLSGDLDVDGHTNLDNISVSGVSTFTGDATFSGNVSIGGTLTYEDVTNIDAVGLITARSGIDVTGGVIEALAGENKIPSLYADLAALPSASTYHGMFAHVHSTGRGYFAHAGNWLELVNKDTNGNVGLSGDLDVDGHTNLDNVSIAGVTTTSGLLDINAGGQANTFKVEDLTDNRIVIAGTGGELEDSANLTFNGSTLAVTGSQTISGDIDVDGHTNLDNVSVSGISTFSGIIDAVNTPASIRVAQDIQHKGDADTKISFPSADTITFDTAGATRLNIASDGNISVTNDIDVDGHTNLDNLSVAGVTTTSGLLDINAGGQANTFKVEDLTSGRVVLAGTGGELEDSNNLRFDGTDLFVSGIRVGAGGGGIIGLDITTRNLKATGISTFVGNVKFDSTIAVHDGTTGSNGQYLKSIGTGVTWASFPTLRTRDTITASAGQTLFSFNYTVNFIDVYVNGIKLTDAEFTATNGTSVVLAVGCFVGDIVELVSYNTVSTGAGGGGGTLNNIVEDTSPQLGGNLDLFSKTINGNGGINISGVVTATTFIGDGSGLTGITASGTGVVIKNNDNTVGTAGTINFGDDLSVTPIVAGIVTVGIDTSQINLNKLNVSGISTFNGNIDVNADLDVDGHTNLDNVSVAGVVTATTFVGAVTGNVTGNATGLSGTPNISVGTISGSTGTFSGAIDANGDLDVDGHTELDNVNIAGVVTATTFKGALQGTSGTFSSNVDITGDLDVDGHTNLDNVNISGVATVGNLTVSGNSLQAVNGNFSNNITANQATFGGNISGPLLSISPASGNDGIILLNSAGGQNNDFSRIRQAIADDSFIIENKSSGSYESFFKGNSDRGAELHFQGSKKLETLTGGVSVTGKLTAGHADIGTVIKLGAAGIITATSFVGDGSGLTGITASGSGVVVKDTGSLVGTAGTIDFGSGLDVSPISAGIVTVTANATADKISELNSKVEVVDTGSGSYVTVDIDGTEAMRISSGRATVDYLRVGSNWDMASTSGTGLAVGNSGNFDYIASSGSSGLDLQNNTSVSIGQNGFPNYDYARFTNSGGQFKTGGTERFSYEASGILVGQKNVSVGATIGVNGHAEFAGIASVTQGVRVNADSANPAGNSATNYISVGESQDLKIYHNGTQNYITAADGTLLIQADNIMLVSDDTAGRSLYQDNANSRLELGFDGTAAAYVSSSNVEFVKPIISSENNNEKIVLSGANNPYIQFKEGSTNKALIGWHSDGYFKITNNEDSSELRIKDSIEFTTDSSTYYTVWHAGNDGASSGLNADLLDGQEGSYYTNAANLSGTLPAISGANLTNLPVPTQITVADESSDQSCNILFTTAATGDLAPKTGTNLTFDSQGGVLSATLFSGSGASLHSLNASNIGSGTMSASRLTGALPAISGANLTNLPAPTPADTDVQVTFDIAGNSGSGYTFTGPGNDGSTGNPDIYLVRGQRYRFINTTGTGHPFEFRNAANNADYTDGITGSQSGTQDFNVQYDAPSQLKYRCTIHTTSMLGNIFISGGEAGRRTTAAAATGSIANAAAANISISAAKTYSLLKVQTSAAAWVTLYTDSTSRSNDASRGETTDPTPGSGVIAEVITSGASTQILSPGVIGWNNDATPSSTVYAKVVNKSGSTQAITVTLHYLQMEI